jgi:hypothetical protein
MKLQNGYELTGNISFSTININDEWTQILIIETDTTEDVARQLFESNNVISDIGDNATTIYYTKGLIDVKVDSNKSYVWLYYNYSIENTTNTALKNQMIDLIKSMIQ